MTRAEMERAFGPNWRFNAVKVKGVPFYFHESCDPILGSELNLPTGAFLYEKTNQAHYFRFRGKDFPITKECVVLLELPMYNAIGQDSGLSMYHGKKYNRFEIGSFEIDSIGYSELEKEEFIKPYNIKFDNNLLEED